MALLVNYEGTYQPPQKLWYLVDGVWTEVKQVFESKAQTELAVIDQERIKQDQVVAALQTKIVELQSRLDGSDITIPVETDPIKLEEINTEIDLINLQLNVAKTEQVVMTKTLFEQKAQMEYIKLVSEGEKALSKIASLVTNPVEWLCIRVAPQSTLDERLELVIQHGLETNERIFNYGLVYYRLIELNSELDIDNIDYLKNEFKRRLSKDAYDKGIEAINYIFTVDSIQNVYTEVNQFVNAGAKRIEDYLASIKDQQKFILDSIEQAKEAMVELEQAVTDGLLAKNVDGQILTKSSLENLQVPLGAKLLTYQNVTSFEQLVSTQVLNDIASGIKDINDYPGIQKLNNDAVALNEKVQAIKDFQEINSTIVNDLASGTITFNLNILTTKKQSLNVSKNLFWNSPLGESTISTSAGKINYVQTYTSSGMYKFKTNELVSLNTNFLAIVNVLMANAKVGEIGISLNPGENIVRIVQAVEANTIIVSNDEINIENKTKNINIVSKVSTNPKEFDIETNLDTYVSNYIINISEVKPEVLDTNLNTSVNIDDQNHPGIPFVYRTNPITPDILYTLDIEHPIINGLFYANTVTYDLNTHASINVEPYLYSHNIRQLNKLDTYNGFDKFDISTDNITPRTIFISNFISCSNENTISLSLPKQSPLIDGNLYNQKIISYVDSSAENTISLSLPKAEQNLESLRKWIINIKHEPVENPLKLDQIYNYSDNSQITLNGYNQTITLNNSTIDNGFTVFDFNTSGSEVGLEDYYSVLKDLNFSGINIDLTKAEENIITSQTGLKVIDFNEDFGNNVLECLNIAKLNSPRINILTGTSTIVLNDTKETLNVMKTNNPVVTTLQKINLDTQTFNYIDNLNVMKTNNPVVTTLQGSTIYQDIESSDLLNTDRNGIPRLVWQINPGVII